MYIKSLELNHFRNYRELAVEFDPGVNILYGSNAQGKTNILEAVYLAGTTRSHRGSKDRDMIFMGGAESHIRVLADRKGSEYRIDVHLKRNKGKGFALNGVPLKRAADLYGVASLVFFSPEDLSMIKNGPSGRRRFLDQMLCGIDRIYLSDLANYSRALAQRNALLKEMRPGEDRISELDIWDLQLAASGKKIIRRRAEFIRAFQETAAEKHAALTNGEERLKIRYEPSAEEALFEERLFAGRETDLRMRTTGTGPHRDDIAFLTNGMDLRPYGSQGQQRTAVLSLKLAEIETVTETRKERPVLLLDDVLSELDSNRQDALLRSVSRTQTLITCTGLDEFVQKKFHADRTYHIEAGRIE